MKTKSSSTRLPLLICACLASMAAAATAESVTNGGFSSGLSSWTTTTWTGSPTFGINANGPTDTSGASGNYAFVGGDGIGLLAQNLSLTSGQNYRLTFLAGGSAVGGPTSLLSLRQEALGNYNSASLVFNPSTAGFQTYTVDFTAGENTIGLWLRNDGANFTAWDNVSVTAITNVEKALDFSAPSGYSLVTSSLSGPGAVTVAGTGNLTLSGDSTYTGGTVVNIAAANAVYATTSTGALGATNSAITVSSGKLDVRTTITREGAGTITIGGDNARIYSGDATGAFINNGSAVQFQGGSLELPLSGSGGLEVGGGGLINSTNSYTGATVISNTTGWYGTNTFYVSNANALGDAAGDLTISGGTISLNSNTITRTGNLTISGGHVHTGTLSKPSGAYDIQGGQIDAVLAGAAGLTKSGAGTATLWGPNTYAGATLVNAGTLVAGNASSLGSTNAAVTVNSGTLDVRTTITRGGAGTITIGGESASILSGDATGSLVNDGSAVQFLGGYWDLPLSGSGGLNVAGGGQINSSNSYTGATVISNTTGWLGTDSLYLVSASALGAGSGDLTFSGGVTRFQSNTVTRSGNVTISGGTLVSGTLDKTGGVFDLQGGSAGVTLAGTAGLTKSGTGTSFLYVANSYTGATTITGGTLVTDGAGQLPAGTTVAISNGATWQMTASYSANGDTRTIGGLTGQGTVQTTASGFTHNLTVNQASGTDTFSGVIAGSGALTKDGGGTLVLGGSNSYTGNTTVTLGTLVVNNNSATTFANTSTLSIASGAVLNLPNAATSIVGTLVLGTTTHTSGIFDSSTPGGYITGSGKIQVGAAAGFSSWITGTFANGAVPSGKQGPNDDPDNDGIRNLVEYAVLGQDPTVSNPAIGSFTGNVLSYTKRAGTSGLTYAIEESTDLGVTNNWTEVTGGSYVNNATTISYTLTPGTHAKNFFRLNVKSN